MHYHFTSSYTPSLDLINNIEDKLDYMSLGNQISHREQQILILISSELTMKEIAAHLFISIHTVISHRKNLMIKMDARNTAGLVRKGYENGYLKISTNMQTKVC